MRKRFLKKLGWYGLSLFLFWNALVAVRAWKFTHFTEPGGGIQTRKAGVFSGIINRFAGQHYFKPSNTEKPAVPYSTVYLFTSGGLRLECWFIKAALSKGTVIIYHGLLGSKQNMLHEAAGLHHMGYNVLMPDFRAHGGSDGKQCTLGLDESEDVKLAFEYIRGRGETNIVLYGSSMGAATITHAVSCYGLQPQKVVLDMPFASYEQLIEKWFSKSKYPSRPAAKLFTFWAGVLNDKWMFAMKPSQYARALQCPVLLQWGRQDQLVPESAIQKIYSNISAPKKLVVYENTGHTSFCKAEPEIWRQQLTSFLQR